jgi:hypothetical protein
MKLFITSLLLTIFAVQGYSQLLQGEWEGNFIDNKVEYPIFLEFILKPDSSYSVTSYSKGGINLHTKGDKMVFHKDSVIVCAVYYKYIPPDSVYLEEIKVLQPADIPQTCFQKMYLKIEIEKDKVRLVGDWKSKSCSPNSSGKITFWKKREYPAR